MNSSIKGITIELGGNTGPLGNALKDVEKNSRDLQSELKEVNRQLKFDPTNTTLLQQKQELLAQSITQTKDKLGTLKEAEKQVEQQFKDGTIGEQNYRAFQREVANTESKLKDLEKQAGLCNTTLSNISSATGKAGSALESAGNKMLPATIAIVGAGAAATKMGSDFIESSNKADVAFGNSAEQVKKFSETSLKNFGIASGSALDMASTYGDMATSMGLSKEQAAKMSTSLVGLAGDLSSFKNIDLSQSSDALNAIFTGETESLKKLGIVMTDANLNSYALANGYGKTTDKMSESEKVQLRYAYVLSATKNAQGDFARTSDGAANSVRVASESAKEAGETFGVMLAPIIAKIAKAIASMVQGFAGLDSGTKQVILTILGIVAAVAPALIIAGKIALGISNVTKAMAIMRAATFAQIAAQTSLNAALLANPITWIVVGIVALVAAFVILWVKCEGFRNFWIGLWNGIKTVIGTVVTAVVGFFESLPQKISAIFTAVLNFLKQWGPLILAVIAPFIGIPLLIAQHWGQITAFFSQLWNAIISFFASLPAKFAALMVTIGNAIWNGIQAIGTFWMKLPGLIGYALGFALGTLVKWGINLGVWIATEVPKLITNIGTFFAQLPGKIWDALVNAYNQLNKWGQQAVNWVITEVPKIISQIGTFFAQLPGKIWDAAVAGIQKLHDFEWSIINWAAQAIPQFIGNVGNFFAQLPGRIWNAIIGAVSSLANWGGQMLNTAKNAASSVVNGIIGFFTGLPGDIMNIGKNIVQGLWDGITGAWHTITDGVKNLTSGFVSGFKNALGIHSPSTIFAGIGGFISQGLANGISDTAGMVSSALQSMASNSADSMKKSLMGSDGLQAAFDSAASKLNTAIPLNLSSATQVNAAMTAANGGTQTASKSGAGTDTGARQNGGGTPTFVQQNTYNSPKALSPAEAARQTRNATRQFVLALQKG